MSLYPRDCIVADLTTGAGAFFNLHSPLNTPNDVTGEMQPFAQAPVTAASATSAEVTAVTHDNDDQHDNNLDIDKLLLHVSDDVIGQFTVDDFDFLELPVSDAAYDVPQSQLEAPSDDVSASFWRSSSSESLRQSCDGDLSPIDDLHESLSAEDANYYDVFTDLSRDIQQVCVAMYKIKKY